jgi:hypothetical protein
MLVHDQRLHSTRYSVAAIVVWFIIKQFYAANGMNGAAGHPSSRDRSAGLCLRLGGAVYLLLGLKCFFFDMHQ